MTILVVGNDQRTQILARSLQKNKQKVRLISDSQEFCELVADTMDQCTYHGDPSDPSVLAMAGAAHCDLLIAMSQRDADNLVICELAKRQFGVPRTIATVESSQNSTVFQKMGVDAVVCTAEICSNAIENAALLNY